MMERSEGCKQDRVVGGRREEGGGRREEGEGRESKLSGGKK